MILISANFACVRRVSVAAKKALPFPTCASVLSDGWGLQISMPVIAPNDKSFQITSNAETVCEKGQPKTLLPSTRAPISFGQGGKGSRKEEREGLRRDFSTATSTATDALPVRRGKHGRRVTRLRKE